MSRLRLVLVMGFAGLGLLGSLSRRSVIRDARPGTHEITNAIGKKEVIDVTSEQVLAGPPSISELAEPAARNTSGDFDPGTVGPHLMGMVLGGRPVIPEGAVERAALHREKMIEAKGGVPTPSFAAATWELLGPGNAGGRTRAIVMDPGVADRIVLGAAGGGIWITTNDGASWSAADDTLNYLSISCMTIDPNNRTVLYAGTGENVFPGSSSVPGQGIYKSTDAGMSWSLLSSTDASSSSANSWRNVSRIAVSPANSNRVLATTIGGTYLSCDAGGSWARQLAGWTQQVVFDPTDGCRALIARRDGTIWYTTTGGGSCGDACPTSGVDWTQASLNGNPASSPLSQYRVDNTDPANPKYFLDVASTNEFAEGEPIAVGTSLVNPLVKTIADGTTLEIDQAMTGVAPGDAVVSVPANRSELAWSRSSPNIVYASMNVSTGVIWKSTDRGQTFNFVSNFNHLGGQGEYDNSLWVDPTDEDQLVIGGIGLFRSPDGGATREDIGCGAHSDQHIVVEHPDYDGSTNKRVYIGNDGGIFVTDDILAPEAPNPPCDDFGWTELNNNLGITQFYYGAVNPTGRMIGGTQDNGVWWHIGQAPGTFDSESWERVAGGDGWEVHADQSDANYFYFIIGPNPGRGTIWQSTNGGRGYTPLPGAPDPASPYMLDPSDPTQLICGRRQVLLASNLKSPPPVWRTIKDHIDPTDTSDWVDQVSAVEISPFDSDVMWVGHLNGDIYRSQDAISNSCPTSTCPSCSCWTKVDDPAGSRQLPDRVCSGIEIDPNDPNRVYIAFGPWHFEGDNVWMSDNALDTQPTWKPITGFDPSSSLVDPCDTGLRPATALPCEPVTVMTLHEDQEGLLYAGGWHGAYVSDNYGATWQLLDLPVPFADVRDLDWENSERLVVTTHSRGLLRADGVYGDCNANDLRDIHDIHAGRSEDCNGNGLPDECDIGVTSEDCDTNGEPDECYAGPDCNSNGIPDSCERDCNGNFQPDDCDIAAAEPVSLFDALDPARYGRDSSAIVSADFDGDGFDDLATTIFASTGVPNAIVVYLNQGEDAAETWLGWGPAQVYTFLGAPTVPWALTTLDHNGDDHVDLAAIVGNGDPLPTPCVGCGDLYVGINNGSGIFDFTDRGIVTLGFFPSKEAISAADIDGDGQDEVVLADTDRGDIYFEGATPRIVFVGGDPEAVATGRFNPDGHADVALANSSFAEVEVLINDRAGSFGADIRRFAVGGTPVSIDVGDVNKDGFLDIAVATTTDTEMLINQTDGNFAIAADPSVVPATTVRLVDLDRDTWLDIVTTQNTVLESKVRLNQGDGTFGAPFTFISFFGISLTALDFNGDGFTDMAAITDAAVPFLAGNDTTVDCNNNGVPDNCDIDNGWHDDDMDGLLDYCEGEDCDVDGDGDCDLADWRTIQACLAGPGVACSGGAPRGPARFQADLDGDYDFDMVDIALFMRRFKGERDCCNAPHGPGCLDTDVENCVCATLPECCTTEWTLACVVELELGGCGSCSNIESCGDDVCNAAEDCVTCSADCGSCKGSCCKGNDTLGCDGRALMTCVCGVEPACCTGTWTRACADIASRSCVGCCGNGACDAGENCWDCPIDCGDCNSLCGNDNCESDENCFTCSLDCRGCVGDCCGDNLSPGCDDRAVQDCVCAIKPSCCTDTWQKTCALIAAESCGSCCGDGTCQEFETCDNCPDDCGTCPGSCCLAGDAPGCTNPSIESCVCDFLPECCEEQWDENCAISAEQCGACGGDCCAENGSPGCSDQLIEACVCSKMPSCCDGDWTDDCANAVEALGCGACPGSCCLPGDAPGCLDTQIESCVCSFLSSCCTEKWSVQCAISAQQCGACGGDCCVSNGSAGCSDLDIAACVCADDPYCCEVDWDGTCVNEVESLNCGDCPDEPPSVSIDDPANDTSKSDGNFIYDGFDQNLGLWYTDVTLKGAASDPEDGALTGASLVWTTDRTDIQPNGQAQLGTGVTITVRLYSNNCFGVWHEVTLTATDSDGNVVSVTRRIFLWTLC